MEEGEGDMIERYRDLHIASIWSNEARIGRWHQIEVENMRRVTNDELADALARIGPPALTAIGKWEKQTHHDVMAFLEALDSKIQLWIATDSTLPVERLRQWLHYGLTSCDLTDTATHMALVKTSDLLHPAIFELYDQLRAMAKDRDRSINDQTIGRTHGQWAAPMPAGHPWRVLSSMLNRAIGSTEFSVSIGKMSGPVGTSSSGERTALASLIPGLVPTVSSQLVPRDYIARWATAVTDVTDVCDAIATRVWLLAQQEVGEVREGRANGQIGSSAMPHKRNPIMSEHIRGLCRMARGYRDMLRQGVVQWGEHDLAHSCVERVALPDLCHIAMRIVTRTRILLANLEFTPAGQRPADRMAMIDTHAELMEKQREGIPYVEAHAQIRARYHGGKIATDNEEAHA